MDFEAKCKRPREKIVSSSVDRVQIEPEIVRVEDEVYAK